MPPPSSTTCRQTVSRVAPASECGSVVPGRRIFGGVVQQIEQHLLEQHGIDLHHRQIGLRVPPRLDAAQESCSRAAARCRRSRRGRAGATFGTTAPDFELGHVEQVGDETVEPLRLVDDRRQEDRPSRASPSFSASSRKRARRAEDGGQRRLEIMRDRRQQRRAQPLGLGGALDPVHVLDQVDALDRQRAPGRSAHRAAAAGPASAAAPACRCRCRRRRRRRGRCASAGTAAWRRAAYRSRARRRGRSPRPSWPRPRSASSSVSSGG